MSPTPEEDTRHLYEEAEARTWANKLMKPLTNYWTIYRRLWLGCR